MTIWIKVPSPGIPEGDTVLNGVHNHVRMACIHCEVCLLRGMAEVAPGFRTLTRRDPRVCGPVGEDVRDGHEQEEDVYAGVSP